MKKLKLFIFFLCISGVFLNLNAQGIINKKKELSPSFDDNQQQLNYFSQQSNEVVDPAAINLAQTGIFINQIGDNNLTNIATQSQISDIQLNQFGNSNQIDLKLRAEIIDYTVTQQGNNNLLLEYNMFNGKQLLERTVQQNGNNQNLVIHGTNSIVDKMKITMDKGSQSLIIRNTN
jgi:hypothetical protein